MYILMSGTNFVFMTFRVGDVSGFENVCVAVEIWNFKIWVVQTLSDEKLTITHNVYLDELDKLCIHDFCISDYQGSGQSDFSEKNPKFDLVKLGTKWPQMINFWIHGC